MRSHRRPQAFEDRGKRLRMLVLQVLEERVGLDQRVVGAAGDGGALLHVPHQVGVGAVRHEEGQHRRGDGGTAQPREGPPLRRSRPHPAGLAAPSPSAVSSSARAVRTWRRLREKTRSSAPVERTRTDW